MLTVNQEKAIRALKSGDLVSREVAATPTEIGIYRALGRMVAEYRRAEALGKGRMRLGEQIDVLLRELRIVSDE